MVRPPAGGDSSWNSGNAHKWHFMRSLRILCASVREVQRRAFALGSRRTHRFGVPLAAATITLVSATLDRRGTGSDEADDALIADIAATTAWCSFSIT